jgi:CubicO group peptidase (beta-lactamase class C family)/pimeloyl-ACP methyl ester carboxylesterase
MSRSGSCFVGTALSAMMFVGAADAANAQTCLDELLTPYLARYELPALAAAVVQDGKVIAVGAVGTRKAGDKIPATVNDRFHLGSNAKAMTALLAAMLVEEGKLKWTSTLPDVFPKLTETMDAGLKAVTLEQFLSHASGIPADNQAFSDLLMKSLSQHWVHHDAPREAKNYDELRYWLVQEWSKLPLESKPGTRFAYANMNYIIAGAMIERAAGRTWEQLIRERIFTPLELKTAGLGCQSTVGKIDAPLGHVLVDGKAKALLAGPEGDYPTVVGPAGLVHMSILDFARWAGWNAGEGKRGPSLVKPETLKKLHTPVISMSAAKDAPSGMPPTRYGNGWGLAPGLAPEPLLTHSGNNELNFALIVVDPKRDFAFVVVTNIGHDKSEKGVNSLAIELYAKYGKGKGNATTDLSRFDTSGHKVSFVTVEPGVELEVLDWGGTGETMVLLAGLGNTAHVFDDFAHQFTDRFHVMGITRRGFGRSSQPALGYDIATRARDDIKVLDSLNIPAAVLVGHSIAGTELSKIAADYPDRVKRLVYLDSLDYGWGGFATIFRAMPTAPPPPEAEVGTIERSTAYMARTYGYRMPIAELCQQVRADSAGKALDFITSPEISNKIVEGLEQAEYDRINAPSLGIFAQVTLEELFPFYADLDRAKQGLLDRYMRSLSEWQAKALERFRTGVKNAQIIELHNSHHYVFIRNEALVAREMRKFLEK